MKSTGGKYGFTPYK